MNTDRIKEIQQTCAYPDSISVQQALLQVWNECAQEKEPSRPPQSSHQKFGCTNMKIVRASNYDKDDYQEEFILWPMDVRDAHTFNSLLNNIFSGPEHPDHFKTVPENYVLLQHKKQGKVNDKPVTNNGAYSNRELSEMVQQACHKALSKYEFTLFGNGRMSVADIDQAAANTAFIFEQKL
jgi:hypothetical protein